MAAIVSNNSSKIERRLCYTIGAGILKYFANVPLLNVKSVQSENSRHWQKKHVMQGAELLATTRSPIFQSVMPAPSATICPAASCPNTVGGLSILACPPRRQTFKSVPQVVAAPTSITTSPTAGVGSGTGFLTEGLLDHREGLLTPRSS